MRGMYRRCLQFTLLWNDLLGFSFSFFLFYNFLLSSSLTFLQDVEYYLFFFFFQVIDLIEYKAEDDDDCYELQNILMDPHVAVSHLKVPN